ncbi:MAG: Dabb family protein [Acidimicrobiia bacterium]
MLRHVVMFRWAEDVDDAHVAAAAAGLDDLPRQIPEIVQYRHGADAGINEGNFDYVVVGDFASAEDYVVYRDHPVHQALIQQYIAGRVADRAAVQYEIAD